MKRMIGSLLRVVHNSLSLVGIAAIVAAVIVAGSVFVLARSDVDVFPGTAAPGAHEFWDAAQGEAQFCSQCHNAIYTELENTQAAGTHPVTACLNCHGAQGTQAHVAVPALCVDCHSNRAAELVNDAHAGLLGQLGETEADASWTCKACHTQVDVNMTTIPMGALEIQLGGP